MGRGWGAGIPTYNSLHYKPLSYNQMTNGIFDTWNQFCLHDKHSLFKKNPVFVLKLHFSHWFF